MSIALPYVLADRYTLERRLGAGSFGETYHARDRLTGWDVAVKLLREQHVRNAAVAERFQQEARTAASMQHPNVVRVLDHGHDGDRYFTVMELVPGGSLRQRIRERGAFPVPEAVALVQGLLDGLESIHRRGIVHRDVKPENILLTPHAVPKLTDFGIACAPDTGGIKPAGVTLGTAAYMAPEQATGSAVSPASDVYAAGAVLYELLTGLPPFPGDEPVEIMYRQVFEPPAAPHALNRAVPPALSRVVLKALEKEPARRYGSAAQMRDALGEALRVADALTLRTSAIRFPSTAPEQKWAPLTRGLGLAAASLLTVFVTVLVVAFHGGANASPLQAQTAAAPLAPAGLAAPLLPPDSAEPSALVERIIPAIPPTPTPTPAPTAAPVLAETTSSVTPVPTAAEVPVPTREANPRPTETSAPEPPTTWDAESAQPTPTRKPSRTRGKTPAPEVAEQTQPTAKPQPSRTPATTPSPTPPASKLPVKPTPQPTKAPQPSRTPATTPVPTASASKTPVKPTPQPTAAPATDTSGAGTASQDTQGSSKP